MLPNPLFSQSNSHSHSRSLSQRASVAASSYKSRRAAAQIKMCRYELINTQFKMFFSQKYKNKKKTNSLRARFARNLIQLFSAGFLSRFSCFILRLSVCSLSASLRDLNIYFFFFGCVSHWILKHLNAFYVIIQLAGGVNSQTVARIQL